MIEFYPPLTERVGERMSGWINGPGKGGRGGWGGKKPVKR